MQPEDCPTLNAEAAFAGAAAILLGDAPPLGIRERRRRLAEALQVVWPHLEETARRFGETVELRALRTAVRDASKLHIVVGGIPPQRVSRLSAHLALVARRLRSTCDGTRPEAERSESDGPHPIDGGPSG